MWRGGVSLTGHVAAVLGSDSYFAQECSPEIENFRQCRRRVADQLRASETVASIGRARHEGPEQQSGAVRRSSAIRKEISSVGWGLSCSASDKIRKGE